MRESRYHHYHSVMCLNTIIIVSKLMKIMEKPRRESYALYVDLLF